MRVIEVGVYRGPHVYSSTPMVRVRLDLDELEAWPTHQLPGVTAALVDLLPGLDRHHCGLGRPGGFLERLRDGTWMGHVVEHVAIELQRLGGMAATRGKTRSVRGRPGVYDVLFAYEAEEVGRAAGALALRLVSSLLPPEHRALDLGRLGAPPPALEDEPIPGLDALRRLAARHRLGPTTRSLADAARRRGIPVHHADDGTLRLGYGARQRRLRASITSETSHLAVELAGDKQRTRSRLESVGIPVPRGVVVRTADEAVAAAARLGGAVVTKPVDGNHGRGVTVGVLGEEAVRVGFADAAAHSRRVVVEEQLGGHDHRVLVVGGRMVAAAERVPARVVGDGLHTVAELVALVNADPRRGDGHENTLTRIRLDPAADRLLAAQQLTRDSVPAPGRVVPLRTTANLSTGGEAIDRTDEVHPENVVVFERAARAIGLDIAGLDVLTPDIARPLAEVGGGIIEVNAAPGFRMHLEPSSGTPRDVATPVIDLLVPRGSRSRIPITAVTGTNGKSTTVRMLGHILGRAGLRVGMATTTGVYLGEHRIRAVDASGPKSARMLLDDPQVETAVVEAARGGILREGLAVGGLDVGIFLNVAADHLGLRGVDTLDDLARVKSVVVREVRRRGLSLLNADDPRVSRLARIAGGRPGFVTVRPLTDRLRERLAAGALVAALEPDELGGLLVLHDGSERVPLLRAAEIPATLGGAATFNIQNALAAAAAAFQHRIPPETIAEALRDFEGSFEQNPGRLNLTRAPGFTTILDYAHNPAAITALGEALQALRPLHERFIAVVSTPGDRRDEDILEMGRLAADLFDELVFRERPDGRGRAAGTVVGLLRAGALSAGAAEERVHVVVDESAAMGAALRMAGPRDLVVLMPTDVDAVWRQIHEFAGSSAERERFADDGASIASDSRAEPVPPAEPDAPVGPGAPVESDAPAQSDAPAEPDAAAEPFVPPESAHV